MKLNRWVAPMLLVIFWQMLSAAELIPAYKLPSPFSVIASLKDLILWGMPPGNRLHLHIYFSLERVFYGYVAAVALAVPLGIITGWSSTLRQIVEPVAELIRPIPPLAWIPIAILWLGIGTGSAAFIIFLGAFFPILLSTISGVRSIDPVFIDAARTLNATNRQILLKVLVPGAVPAIFTGLRVGMGIGWMTLVAAEFTGVKQGYGLGYMIMTARDLQRPDAIVAGMLVIGMIGFGIDGLFHFLWRRFVPWRRA
jgi:ABC-type nitrate/sulfonate/bicarbonate transport system permease component